MPWLTLDGAIAPPVAVRSVPVASYIAKQDRCVLEREKRNGHIIAATMHSERLPEQSILIRNLSHRGIGARTLGSPPIEGEEVTLQLVGRVRWVRGNRFGIHLRDPIGQQDRIARTPWSRTEATAPAFQFAERFKPVAKAWRPSVTGFSKATREPAAKVGR